MNTSAIAGSLAIGLGLAAVIFAFIERRGSNTKNSSQGGGNAVSVALEPGSPPLGGRGEQGPLDDKMALPMHEQRIRIHPAVDQGVIRGSGDFAGGTLTCKCTHDPVTVRVASNVAFNHVCGCTKCWKPAGALFSHLV